MVAKLQTYLKERLHRGQVGFVEGQDIYVNMWRALKRIDELRSEGKHVYCLFVDFSAAYNTVPHQALFKKLEGILNEEEIQLIRAIYSRMRIEMGKEGFRPNIGLAQGSVISPALFNIYAESMLIELEKHGWQVEDLLAYADDHLIICTSLEQLELAIQIIKGWSISENIKLNPDKSGIMEVTPKRRKGRLNLIESIEGIPIVKEYKYLGLILDQKLSGDTHIKKLFGWKEDGGKRHLGKIEFIKNNLRALISNISVDYRMNLWQLLIKPLFLPLVMMSNFLCLTNQKIIETKLRKSVKWALGLSMTTPNETVGQLISIDCKEWGNIESERAQKRWESRLERESAPTLSKYVAKCRTRCLPKEFAQFVNLQNVYCKECRHVFNREHYAIHGVQIPTTDELISEIWKDIKGEIKARGETRMKRNEKLERASTRINDYVREMKKVLPH